MSSSDSCFAGDEKDPARNSQTSTFLLSEATSTCTTTGSNGDCIRRLAVGSDRVAIINSTYQDSLGRLDCHARDIWKELNRLKFSSLSLYGRERELKIMHDIFHNFQEWGSSKGHDQHSSNLVTLGGRSGTGKTALVHEFGRQVCNNDKSISFVFGRFEQHKSVPYAAFTSAFVQLCSVVRSREHYDSTMRSSISKAVGSDYTLLIDLIPNIGELLYDAGTLTQDQTASEKYYDIMKSEMKFKFLLLRFLHAICRVEHKVILFLDDMQWMDDASLRLLEIILTDAGLGNTLMVIGTYRDDEVDISNLIQNIGVVTRKTPTDLLVGNLPFEAVRSLIADLLSEDLYKVEGLSRIVCDRVDGNPFFLVHYLTALRDCGYLTYNIGTAKWDWDETLIRQNTVVASNVLAVLMSKIGELPVEVKRVLQIGACLGATFRCEVISIVMDELARNPPKQWTCDGQNKELHLSRPLREILESLVVDGLLELYCASETDPIFCFSHCQIELAAYNLHDDSCIQQLELQIGRILYAKRGRIDFNNMMFTVVDLFNNGRETISESQERRLLIDLNFEVGKKALESSAFMASSSYFCNAISLIPREDRWTVWYDLSLKLYNGLIKAEYSKGKWEQLQGYVDEILAQKNRPILDKVSAYTTLITMISVHKHNHLEAIDLALDVLKRIGVHFRKNAGKLGVIKELLKTKLLLRKVPLNTFLELNEMRDTNKLVALDVLSNVNSSLYAANPDLHFCTILKTIRWSLKYGISKDTAKCLSIFSVVEMAMGDVEGGKKTCQVAIDLAKKQKLMNTEYAPIAISYGFVMPWFTSLHTCRDWMLKGFDIGLQMGDLHYGYLNVVVYCFFSYCAGKPLRKLEAMMKEYARQMEEYNQSLQLQFLSLTWQTTLNLTRHTTEPSILSGEVMDYQTMLAVADRERNPPLRAQVQCHRLQLAVYFRDFDLASKLIGPASCIAAVNPGNPIIWRNSLFEGVAAFELVRRGKRSWRRTAVRALARTKKWVDAGNPNCVHIWHLLQAEKAAMDRNPLESRRLFYKAIACAARSGFRLDQALAYERCADMYSFLFHAHDVSTHYMKKAIEVYTEIEAFGKVASMTNQRTDAHAIMGLNVGRDGDRNSQSDCPEEGIDVGSDLSDSFGSQPFLIRNHN